MHIYIPPQRLNSLGSTLKSLFQIAHIVGAAPEEEVILDFTKSDFLNIVYITGLHCLVKQWSGKGRTIRYLYPSSSLRSYLEAVRFEKGLVLPGTQELSHFHRISTEKSYLPITYLPCYGERINDTPLFDYAWNKVVEAVKRILKTPARDYWQIYPYFFEELGNNVQEHSHALHGIFSFQCYADFIQVVIADCGRGIFESYSESPHFHPNSEPEAFDFAMQGKSAKNRPENESRGFGISTSRDILVNGTAGIYALWSGQTAYVEGATFERGVFPVNNFFPNAHFQGCLSILQIPRREDLLIDFEKATSKA